MRFASVPRRPGRHRARFHIEDGPPFAPAPEDETLTDDDEGTAALEDEAN